MNAPATDTSADTKGPKANREAHLSRDGRWRSFPKVPGLLQYVSTGTYFARAKVEGKLFRQSLLKHGEQSISFTTAKLRLADKLKEFRKPKVTVGTFAEARLLYEADLANDHTLAPKSKQYRLSRIAALLKTWPGLDQTSLTRITAPACKEWARRYAAQFEAGNFNNTLGTLRAILQRGGLGRDENPAYQIKRLGVKAKALQLPEPEQFDKLLEAVENAGARQSHDCADLIRFLAYSGCRISEARQVLWSDVDWSRGEIKVHNAKRSRTSNAPELRFVPIIPPMRELLDRLQKERKPKPTDRVCLVGECERALTAACGVKDGKRLTRTRRGKEVQLGIGIERITHHDLRHLFATRCIEAGVDIPTVSRWLGHVDGGALAMKIYGHLRREHSAAIAQKVTFGKAHPTVTTDQPNTPVELASAERAADENP